MVSIDILCAPVLIPTLNRFEHLKACLESIERCQMAELTVVYVALDYPPSEKYAEGWRKIDSYLKQKEDDNGFKNLIVFRRDHNYGVGKANSNSEVMIAEVSKLYDRFIFTEDDNMLSENALIYFNKMLEKYKDDERIMRIAGYNYDNQYPSDFEENYYLSQTVYPWVTGIWPKKYYDANTYKSFDYLRSIVRNPQTRAVLQAKRPEALYAIVSMIKRNQLFGDTIAECYMMLNDKYYVLPRTSKVRNIGNDGSGVHSLKMSKIHDYFSTQKIDQDVDFELSEREVVLSKKDVKRLYDATDHSYRGKIKRLIAKLDLFLLIYFDYVPKSKYI